MKLNGSDLLRKGQFPLLIACGTYPLAVLATALMAPEGVVRIPVFMMVYAALAVLCLTLPGKVRLAAGAAGCALLLGLGAALLPVKERPLAMILPIGYAVLLMIGLPMGGWRKERELPAAWGIVGVVAHMVAQVMVNRFSAMNDHGVELLRARPLLSASFILFLALMMLSLNRSNIQVASMGRQRVPARVRQRNVLLTLGLLALGLIISVIPGIAQTIQTLWYGLTGMIGALVAWLLSLLPVGDGVPGQSGGSLLADMPFDISETPEPSALALLLEKVMAVAALIILAVLVVLAAKTVYRKLKVLLRYLIERLGRFASSASEDYIDEITDTRDEADAEQIPRLGRIRQRFGESGRQLSPRERIRQRYRRLKRRHPEWYASHTARETIPGSAAELYERARYSDHEVGEEEARVFEQEIKKV